MKRTQWNFAIDAMAFAAFLLLMSTGLLLRYQLPPGSGEVHVPGTGADHGGPERPIVTLWNWTRHEWGDIHYWIAVALVAIMTAHLILHWKWILCVVQGACTETSGFRFGLGLVSLGTLMALVVSPLIVPTETIPRRQLQQERSVADDQALGQSEEQGQLQHADSAGSSDLRGSVTLTEAARLSGLTVAELCDRLGLPGDVSPEERAGPLLRKHGKSMVDLRRLLEETNSDLNDRNQ
ncbi:MAG: DUF4405 domain-containing protein [Planctomycetes bacterium]|nr:DUF4405 domain-containing protein [Planctomycetota bacterium]